MLDNTKTEVRPSPRLARARPRPAQPDDVDSICDLLERHFGGITRSEWQKLFQYSWSAEKPDCGWVLDAGGETERRLVGFVGTVYSERTVNGRAERLCNLTSLCVDEEYRAMAPLLLAAVIRRRDVTLTCLTPAPSVCVMLKAAGFAPLDTGKLIVPPFANLFGLLKGLPKIECGAARIRDRLDDEQRRILDDHVPYGCLPVLVSRGDRRCFLLAKRRVRQHLPISEILFASDADVLARNMEAITWAIVAHQRTGALMCSRRLFGDSPPAGMINERPSLFRSQRITPGQIDHLYSEFVLLPI
jgi:Predicted molecular chaperone distantly related to HSP70-fold metalloproteases